MYQYMNEKKDAIKRGIFLFLPSTVGILIGYAIILLTDDIILQILIAVIVIIIITIGYMHVKSLKNNNLWYI
jgi:uncharacterized membrane protein YfcA